MNALFFRTVIQQFIFHSCLNYFLVTAMERELESALHKGLPYPILKVIEYLSVDRAGFVWGRRYRLAGYYTFVILWYEPCFFAPIFLSFHNLLLTPFMTVSKTIKLKRHHNTF